MALTRLGLNQSVNLASNVTGTLPTGNGGTGATSFSPGKVLQVVQSTSTSDILTNSGSYAASGFTCAITPSATSSKILIQLNGGYIDYDSAALDSYCRIFYKIGSGSYVEQASFTRTRVNSAFGIPNSQNFLTSPNTTSEVTVQPYIKTSTSNNAYINRQGALLTLTLLEIGA